MVYLSSIKYFLDNENPISDLDFLKSDSVVQNKYAAAGIKSHYKTDKSPSEMAYWVLSDFLKENKAIQDQIDTVIFTTDNSDGSNDINTLTANSLLNELGLSQAFPIFQSFSNCANISACFNTASALVESGRSKNVLVVSVDKMGEKDEDYMMKPEMSVLSDAAICLWISSTPTEGALKIEGIFLKNNPQQWLIDRDAEYQQYTVNKLKLFKYIANQVKGITNGKIDHLVLNNYFKHILDMFIGIFKVDKSIVDMNNVSRMGHAPAGDTFINLHDLLKNNKIVKGENVVLVGDSPSLCSGIVLVKI